MMVVANGDDITMWDQEIAAFDAVPSSRKRLVVLPATDHMTLYSDVTALDYAAHAAGWWFNQHLQQLPTVENRFQDFD